MITKYSKLISLLVVALTMSGCADFVEIDQPRTELTTVAVFQSDATAEAAMAGVYVRANQSTLFLTDGWFESDVAYITAMSADDLKADTNENGVQLVENELLPTNTRIRSLWTGAYRLIYLVNSILEGVSTSKGISLSKRNQLEGEARFMRAFTYLYLVNLFGDVPLILTTDYRENAQASRTPESEVYTQIMTDLQTAFSLLPQDYTTWKNERIRPTQSAALALMARVALYRQQWQQAEADATTVINKTNLFQLVTPPNVFLKNNQEAIWQFLPIKPGSNTNHGYVSAVYRFSVQVTESLLNAFEANDARYANWIGIQVLSAGGDYKYATKYKADLTATPVEYTTNLRLAEQHLIRAEARAQQNNIEGALEDINVIRQRAGLPEATAATQQEVMTLLMQERRVELFIESGHRWLDLKRWNLATEILGSKPGWQQNDVWYPIPESEINRNKNLIQNPGYGQ